MATKAEVTREQEAPVVATLDLTEAELQRVFDNAVFDEVSAQRASDLALSDVGAPAMYTLADKVRKLYRCSQPTRKEGAE